MYLDVLHQSPGRAQLLFTDGAGEDHRLRVGGVRLGVQLLPLALRLALHQPPLLVLVGLAGAGHAGRADTFLPVFLFLAEVLHVWPIGQLGLARLSTAVGGFVLDVGHQLLQGELGLAVTTGEEVSPGEVSPSSSCVII